MDFLGVGPFEFLFILVVSIIVLGPERLQQTARSLGRLFARVMAWQYQSPEAQMIQQIRKDFEQEIVDLRNELIRARKQFDISSDVQEIHQEIRSAINVTEAASPQAIREAVAARRQANALSTAPAHHSAPSTEAVAPSVAPTISNGVAASANQDDQLLLHFLQSPTEENHTAPSAAALSVDHLQALRNQLDVVVADLQALQHQLRAHGVLDAEWQLPSEANQHSSASLHHQ
jgi:Sec-independent protein translocase protein TatA